MAFIPKRKKKLGSINVGNVLNALSFDMYMMVYLFNPDTFLTYSKTIKNQSLKFLTLENVSKR